MVMKISGLLSKGLSEPYLYGCSVQALVGFRTFIARGLPMSLDPPKS